MRLTTAEHQAIRQAITKVDPEASIYLFGSRANDNARGGDIPRPFQAFCTACHGKWSAPIAHEYAADRLPEIYQSVSILTPRLLAVVPRVLAYGAQLEKRYAQTTMGK